MIPMDHKHSFLVENQQFMEDEFGSDCRPVGKLEDIDLVEDEVWLLQCPKGMDVKQLESQKLKIPGRTNLDDSEAVSVEFVEGVEQHAFAYSNRKGRYDLRLLPIRGTIVLRNRLKAAATITCDRVEECCPPAKRVPMPSAIRVRHPLLGHQYAEKLELDDNITTRLQEADRVSAQMLKDSFEKNVTAKRKSLQKMTPIEINSEDDADETDAVVFVSEEIVKKKKSKRKHSENKDGDDVDNSKKKKKSKKSYEDQVSKDLQWLQNL